MQKLLTILKAFALATVPIVGAGTLVLQFQLSAAVKDTREGSSALRAQASDLLMQGKSNLVFAGKLTNDARVSVDNLNKAAIDERFYFEKQLPNLMDQAHGILANVQVATADVDPLLREVTSRTHELAPIEASAAELVKDVDVTAKDPHIASSLANLDTSSAELVDAGKSGVATAKHVEHIAADAEAEVHSLTHPKPLVSIANWTLKAVHAVGGFF